MGKIRKAVSAALLPPSPAKIINADGIKNGWNLIDDSIKSMSKNGKKYRIETFEEAVERLGLDEKRIKRRRFELLVESRIMYALAAVSLAAMLYFAFSGEPLGVYSSICSFTIGAVGGFCRAFRVDQVDRSELYSFPEFWRSPEAWFK